MFLLPFPPKYLPPTNWKHLHWWRFVAVSLGVLRLLYQLLHTTQQLAAWVFGTCKRNRARFWHGERLIVMFFLIQSSSSASGIKQFYFLTSIDVNLFIMFDRSTFNLKSKIIISTPGNIYFNLYSALNCFGMHLHGLYIMDIWRETLKSNHMEFNLR